MLNDGRYEETLMRQIGMMGNVIATPGISEDVAKIANEALLVLVKELREFNQKQLEQMKIDTSPFMK